MKLPACIVLVAFVAAMGWRSAFSQGYSPEDAVARMSVADGLAVTLYASEPHVRQPIFVKCDDRGRVWTIQYLQYPNPAGLTRVQVDRWSRTIYDRIPEPPPRGPRGADKITILEDVDGDGRADHFKEFVDGLNLVTGVEFGHGGVFVLNVPYLLFYPDKNRDDVPDSEPDVLLTGFGMEDAQAMSNHLTWGPDGWLYGVNGSTTTCRIRGLEFQQGLWRYHPLTREFELFCEGGSNCYGVTFDANGECFYSTNGGPFVHAVQGGYYYKSFGKHGPLHNLYAYHYFPEVERDQVPGGPPTGGTVYRSGALPGRLRGAFVAGNFLGHTVSAWQVEPSGSTFRARFREVILDAQDSWFGPTDLCIGPDGSLYVSDFYDQRTAHPDPDANWDRTNGRIYKILGNNSQASAGILDVSTHSSDDLVALLIHGNPWFTQRVRVEMARRRDPAIAGRLRKMATQLDNGQLALEALWALNVSAGIDDATALQLLNDPRPYLRFWTIRLLGDRKAVTATVADRLLRLASSEPSPVVRGQLAASAKRLPARLGLSIAKTLLVSYPNESDSRIPWLVWWAIESKAVAEPALVAALFADSAMWENPAARGNLLRLIRRYAAEGTDDSYEACLQFVRSAPTKWRLDSRQHLRQGLAERRVGLHDIGHGDLFADQASATTIEPPRAARRYQLVAGALRDYIESSWRREPLDELGLELALRADVADARQSLASAISSPSSDHDRQIAFLRLLREFGECESASPIFALLQSAESEGVQVAAVEALASFDRDDVADLLLAEYASMSPTLQSKVRDVLFSRPLSALKLLQQIDMGHISPKDVPIEQLRALSLHEKEAIDALVRRHWGQIEPGTTEEKLAVMRSYNNDLRSGGGDPLRGKALFARHCGTCHRLFGEGNLVGPDLTTANRHDRAALLANIVDPSAVVRREYVTHVVVTSSGQVLSGLLIEQDAASLTILDGNNRRISLPREQVETMEDSGVSMMPERILHDLSPQEIRDLFAHIQQPDK